MGHGGRFTAGFVLTKITGRRTRPNFSDLDCVCRLVSLKVPHRATVPEYPMMIR